MDPEILAAANGMSQALAKLPPVAAVVFRPADLSDAQLARYQPGALVEERGFLSCTLDPARTTDGNTTFAIASVWAKDVSSYSPLPADAEVGRPEHRVPGAGAAPRPRHRPHRDHSGGGAA